MLQANYAISIIIKTFIFIHFMVITNIGAAQNQTTELQIISNATTATDNLFTTNYNISDDDTELIGYVANLFCQLNSNPVYMYIEREMQFSRIIGNMLVAINACMRSSFLMKSINTSESYEHQQLTTNNKLNFTMFIILNRLSDRPDIQFRFISKSIGNKSKKKFILFVNHTSHTRNTFRQLFREFHFKLIYNIVVVARNETANFDVMTYNPFIMSNYVEYFGRNETRLTKLFYNKIFRNIHQRILIKIILFEEQSRLVVDYENKVITGIDGFMLATIMKNMNADYEIRTPRDNMTYGAYLNGSSYGTLKDIEEWYGDISFNSRFLKPAEFFNIVESTVVLGRDDLCLIVPNSGHQSYVGNLLLSFSNLIWILIVFMIFFVSSTLYVTQRVQRQTLRWRRHEIRYVILTVFQSNLNQSLRTTPKTFEMRIVLIAWLFYGILITNAFIANLTSVLILERESQQIDTLSDLAKSGLEILTVFRYKNELVRNLNMSRPVHVQFAKKLRIAEEHDLQALIANNTIKYAYVEKDHVIKYILDQRSHLLRGQRVFHEMQECPVPNLITYITPVGSPYLDHINFLVRQILESGLYGWWRKNLERERRKSKTRRFIKNRHNSEPFKNLALSHLQLVFYLLGFGLTMATIVFVVEVRAVGQKWRQWKCKLVGQVKSVRRCVVKFVKNLFFGRKRNW